MVFPVCLPVLMIWEPVPAGSLLRVARPTPYSLHPKAESRNMAPIPMLNWEFLGRPGVMATIIRGLPGRPG